MAFDLSLVNFFFDALPEVKSTFGNRRNWHRFCAIADEMAAELVLRRWMG